MSETVEVKVNGQAEAETVKMYKDLLEEWFADLTFTEKQVWLWNAAVALLKIIQKRRS